MTSTTATLEVEGIAEPLQLSAWAVSQDVLQVADTFSATIPLRGTQGAKLRTLLEKGARYSFYLSNPEVDGGARSLRQKGLCRGCSGRSSMGTHSSISVKGADLGWHLLNQCAPEFFRLEHVTLERLAKELVFKHPEWGITEVRSDNDLNRRVSQGKLGAQLALQPHVYLPYKVIQINPGQKIWDVLGEYAQREGLMVGVSIDGALQLFNPRYNQAASYELYHWDITDPGPQPSNVSSVDWDVNIDGIYTEVTCVWDEVYTGVLNAPYTPNLGRHRATYLRTGLPWTHRLVFADGEPMSKQQGLNRAVYRAQRDEFGSRVYRFTTPGVHQGGRWWAADTICRLEDTVWGFDDTYYLSSVMLQGQVGSPDQTTGELHRKYLLSNERLRLTTGKRQRKDGVQEKQETP